MKQYKSKYTEDQLTGVKQAKEDLLSTLDYDNSSYDMMLVYGDVLRGINKMIDLIKTDIELTEIFNNDPLGLLDEKNI